jgi:ATP-binding cassette subfamily C protein
MVETQEMAVAFASPEAIELDNRQAAATNPIDTCRMLTRIEVGGNAPLLLTAPGGAWTVDAGSVHVFLVALRGGEPVGTRTYLFSLEPGDLVLSTDEDPLAAEAALLIAGVPGSQVSELARDGIDALLANPATAPHVTARLGTWIDRLAVAARPELPPQQYERLQAGADTELAPGAQGRPLEGLLWVRCRSGWSTVWGVEGSIVPTDGTWFPLSSSSWVTATEPAILAGAGIAQVVEDGGIWSGLRAFHRAALTSATRTAAVAAQAETTRLQRKLASDQQALDQAFAELVNQFEPTLAARSVDADAEDALFGAAKIVGEAAGIEMRRPPKSAARQPGDRLAAIASASRVRMRRVALRGRWWRTESVPMLASLVAGDAPVALVPAQRRGYLLVNPQDGERTAVTAEIADTLAPFAHVFYRPLPEEQLGPRDVLRFALRQVRREMTTVILAGAAVGILALLTPIVTGTLFDTVIPSAQRSQVLVITLALLAAAVASALFQLTLNLSLLRIETKMGTVTQAAVWDRLLNLPVPFFHQFLAGDLQMRAMGIDTIRQILGGAVISSVLAGVFSLFSFALLFRYSVKLALLAAALVVVIVGVTFTLNYLQLRYQRQIMAYQGKVNGMVVQFITGISKLRVAAAENRAFLVWSRTFARQTDVTSKVRMTSVHLGAVQSITPVLSTMTIFSVIYFWSVSISTGSFLAFTTAFGQFLTAMLAMSGTFVALLQVVPIFERAQPILETEAEVSLARADPGLLTGDIEMNHVSFRYQPDGPLVLNDISLRVKPGEFVALVGPSGSGKSTVLRLLMGFETPSSGAIYFEQQDLADLDVRAIRRQVGVVLQHSQLMPGDIQTNILGNSGYTVEDAWEAARMAGFDEDIKSMPMGMFTVVSEGMSTLSGGQRQRLMIARALVTRPRVVFFDEATSALDNQTQATVSRSLERLQATRVVIAHRLSTIRNADRLYVIQGGRLVETGSYDELIAADGLFAALVRRQLT